MQPQTFDDVLELIVAKDPRYPREAYHFVREALDYTQQAISKADRGQSRHVSGQELLAGVRTFALEQYGPLALLVLTESGLRRGEDVGEIVFSLVENGLFSKTDTDNRADFQGGYDFEEAFRKPFLPARPAVSPPVPPVVGKPGGSPTE